ncbi:MAG: branched-chain amino acid ABC transporter permease [Alphaproteobacteria bacterium]|jgi:branched-chain amino acid transport system permease protein|nr:branched-chain amino acid ABC transporter permease [Alphaproteobacteria bacterium]MBT5162177.1 branched-chain amino acid ABC transporter permease [Alphaproteobacteria bacterium]MBT6387930.1 branched-chain amino acid ABC transporter permease [Alphaproteobacteria bacterium]
MFTDPTFLFIQTLNGLQLAMLLFLLSVGLSVIFGLMNFINLAHGTLYMLGAYFGLWVYVNTGSFWVALALAPIGVMVVGMVFYVTLIKRLRTAPPLKQVLVTFGLIFVGLDAVRMSWGNLSKSIPTPDVFSQSVTIFGEIYPSYRLFIIGLGVAVFVILYFVLERTRIGSVIRAGVDDRDMVSCLGINVDLAFFGVFCIGCYLAGLSGAVAGAVFPVEPGMDMSILILTLIVVVVGGLGSLKGAVVGSLMIGMAETFGQVFLPQFASVTIYALMVVVLLVRPGGLFPTRAA